MLRALARAIVRRYPPPWRARYEDEVLALIEDSPVRFGDLGELVRGLIVERSKALVEPGDSPRLSAFVFRFIAVLVRIAPSVLLIVGAASLSELARVRFGIASENVSFAGVVLLMAVVVGFVWRKWSTRAQHRWVGPTYHFFPTIARVAMLSALFLGTFLMQWGSQWSDSRAEPVYAVNRWLRLYMYILIADGLTSGFWPWRPMLDAFSEYNTAIRDLRWAHMEVNRCRSLVDAGAAAHQDLENAEIARDRLVRRRDEAAAILHGYGYRAKFQ
jgi:hypothetical protein